MGDKSRDQEKRLSAMIDRMFPGFSKKGQLMASLGSGGDYAELAEMSDSELKEMISMEKEYMGG